MGAAGLALRRLQWAWRRSPRPIGQRRHGRRHGRSLRWQRDRVAGRSEGCILPTAGWVHHLERQWRAPSAQRRRERVESEPASVAWDGTELTMVDAQTSGDACPPRAFYNAQQGLWRTMAVDRPCGPSEYLVSSGALSSEATRPCPTYHGRVSRLGWSAAGQLHMRTTTSKHQEQGQRNPTPTS